MDIPAFFASYRSGEMTVTDGIISGPRPSEGTRYLGFRESVARGVNREARSPVMIIDCDSFSEGCFSEKVMKHMTVKGADVWMMTYIESVEDVFDAFNKDAEYVFAPYHFTYSDDELEDICSVSDSFVPSVFVRKGTAYTRSGRPGDVMKLMDKLVGMGFYRNCIVDTDGSVTDDMWSVIASDYPSSVPYPYSGRSVPGFRDTIIPFMI